MEKYKVEISKIFEGMSNNMSDILTENKCMIAGGIISRVFTNRSTELADVDVYFRSKKNLAEALYQIDGTSDIVFDYTDKSIMIKSGEVVVQFIIMDYFENPTDIFKRFDFTCVMGAFDCKDDTFHFHEDFFLHNAQRKLHYNPSTDFPIISALRVDKYKKEGYSISKMEYLKVLMSIMNLKVSSWEEAEKQFGKFYGISLASIITDEVKKKEFSIENLMALLDEFEFDYKTVEEHNKKSIPNFDSFVADISGYKRPVFQWKEDKYFVKIGDKFVSVNNKDEYGEVFTLDVNTSKVYKFVVKNGDELHSQYQRPYKYKVGENAVDNGHGLYFYYDTGVSTCKSSYGQSEDRVLIECEVVRMKQEANLPDSVLICHEVKVLRIVPKEEADLLIEKSKSFEVSGLPF